MHLCLDLEVPGLSILGDRCYTRKEQSRQSMWWCGIAAWQGGLRMKVLGDSLGAYITLQCLQQHLMWWMKTPYTLNEPSLMGPRLLGKLPS